MVPAAIGRNNESRVMPTDADELGDLRMPLRTFLSECDLITERTAEGVKEESRVRR